jgi:hypothetical protein
VTKESHAEEDAASGGQQQRQPEEADAGTFSVTGTLSQQFWLCPGAAGFKVRGATYLQVCS